MQSTRSTPRSTSNGGTSARSTRSGLRRLHIPTPRVAQLFHHTTTHSPDNPTTNTATNTATTPATTPATTQPQTHGPSQGDYTFEEEYSILQQIGLGHLLQSTSSNMSVHIIECNLQSLPSEHNTDLYPDSQHQFLHQNQQQNHHHHLNANDSQQGNRSGSTRAADQSSSSSASTWARPRDPTLSISGDRRQTSAHGRPRSISPGASTHSNRHATPTDQQIPVRSQSHPTLSASASLHSPNTIAKENKLIHLLKRVENALVGPLEPLSEHEAIRSRVLSGMMLCVLAWHAIAVALGASGRLNSPNTSASDANSQDPNPQDPNPQDPDLQDSEQRPGHMWVVQAVLLVPELLLYLAARTGLARHVAAAVPVLGAIVVALVTALSVAADGSRLAGRSDSPERISYTYTYASACGAGLIIVLGVACSRLAPKTVCIHAGIAAVLPILISAIFAIARGSDLVLRLASDLIIGLALALMTFFFLAATLVYLRDSLSAAHARMPFAVPLLASAHVPVAVYSHDFKLAHANGAFRKFFSLPQHANPTVHASQRPHPESANSSVISSSSSSSSAASTHSRRLRSRNLFPPGTQLSSFFPFSILSNQCLSSLSYLNPYPYSRESRQSNLYAHPFFASMLSSSAECQHLPATSPELEGFSIQDFVAAEIEWDHIFSTDSIEPHLAVGMDSEGQDFWAIIFVEKYPFNSPYIIIHMHNLSSEVESIKRGLRLEQARIHIQNNKQQLAYGSHDMLNYVSCINTAILSLRKRTKQSYVIDVLNCSSLMLEYQLRDTLDTIKAKSHTIKIYKSRFSIVTLVEEVVQILACYALQRDVQLMSLIDPSLPSELEGDQGRIKRILVNLVLNAIKFTSRGHVIVTAKSSKISGCVDFEVMDNGKGMTKETKAKIFKPWNQGDLTERSASNNDGVGLGLTSVCQQVSLLSGSIAVESELEKGSTFTVSIPLHSVSSPPPPLPSFGIPTTLVLLVMERTPLCELTRMIIQQCSDRPVSCDIVSDETEAINVLLMKKTRYSIVFVDHSFARLAERLRNRILITRGIRPPGLETRTASAATIDTQHLRDSLLDCSASTSFDTSFTCADRKTCQYVDTGSFETNIDHPPPLDPTTQTTTDPSNAPILSAEDRKALFDDLHLVLFSDRIPDDRSISYHLYSTRIFKPLQQDQLRRKIASLLGGSSPDVQVHEATSPIRFLIADDNEMTRESLKIFLNDLGHRVELACNESECVAIFKDRLSSRDRPIDIVLLDRQMPSPGDGIRACRAMRSAEALAPVPHKPASIYYMSCEDIDPDELRDLAGANGYFVKINCQQELLTIIARHQEQPFIRRHPATQNTAVFSTHPIATSASSSPSVSGPLGSSVSLSMTPTHAQTPVANGGMQPHAGAGQMGAKTSMGNIAASNPVFQMVPMQINSSQGSTEGPNLPLVRTPVSTLPPPSTGISSMQSGPSRNRNDVPPLPLHMLIPKSLPGTAPNLFPPQFAPESSQVSHHYLSYYVNPMVSSATSTYATISNPAAQHQGRLLTIEEHRTSSTASPPSHPLASHPHSAVVEMLAHEIALPVQLQVPIIPQDPMPNSSEDYLLRPSQKTLDPLRRLSKDARSSPYIEPYTQGMDSLEKPISPARSSSGRSLPLPLRRTSSQSLANSSG